MGGMRRARLPILLALFAPAVALPGSCAHARNYTDPAGPRYATHYGGATGEHDTVRVVTFNIEHARRIERAIEVLRATPELENADVLLLQEMDAPGTERIARALQMNSLYIPSSVHPHDEKDFGNAVLSPWPIERGRKLLLPHESRIIHLRRAVAVADLLVGRHKLRVYSVHVETRLRLGGAARRDQVQAILEDARPSREPVLIAGDLNSSTLPELFDAAGYRWLTRDVHHTVAWFDFDHVFARGLHAAAQPPAGVADDHGASDHRPVWVQLRFD